MLNGTGRSNSTIAAVVIGKYQSFAANYLAGTSTAENHDSIFNRSFVNTIKAALW